MIKKNEWQRNDKLIPMYISIRVIRAVHSIIDISTKVDFSCAKYVIVNLIMHA